jgi:hypothetical protein
VDRHPNMRLAYVAQHAFHHLEEHLDISPNRWRGPFGSYGKRRKELQRWMGIQIVVPCLSVLCDVLSLCVPPLRYILRRYSGGEDKEEASKVHRVMTQDEWDKVRKQVR